MLAIKATIERFLDDSQPGWVECRFSDVEGVVHRFHEKVPVVAFEHLDVRSDYPRQGWIGCTMLDARITADGREVVTVDTGLPWHIASHPGLTRFAVFREQLVEFDDAGN